MGLFFVLVFGGVFSPPLWLVNLHYPFFFWDLLTYPLVLCCQWLFCCSGRCWWWLFRTNGRCRSSSSRDISNGCWISWWIYFVFHCWWLFHGSFFPMTQVRRQNQNRDRWMIWQKMAVVPPFKTKQQIESRPDPPHKQTTTVWGGPQSSNNDNKYAITNKSQQTQQ